MGGLCRRRSFLRGRGGIHPLLLHAGPEDAQVVFREQDVVEHPGHRVVANGGLEGVQGRPVPQVEGLLPTPKAFPSGGRWAGPPDWFWWRVLSEALSRGCRRQVVRLGPAQVGTCEVGSRPVPGGGSRLSLEKARTQRVAGGCPPPPLFYGPLVPTRSFWRGGAHCSGGGAVSVPICVP